VLRVLRAEVGKQRMHMLHTLRSTSYLNMYNRLS